MQAPDERRRRDSIDAVLGSLGDLAGVEDLPPELRERYMEDLMADPRTDPELAGYLGLTEESAIMGGEYRDLPAYERMREQAFADVMGSQAGAGTLYSGRRGEALRDVSAETELDFMREAQRQHENMLAARRAERTRAMGARAGEVGAGRQREQSYYNNYMNMLARMASPSTTTNIARMGTDIGKEVGGTLVGTARDVGNLQMGSAANQAAMYGDLAGGVIQMGSDWLARQPVEATGSTRTRSAGDFG